MSDYKHKINGSAFGLSERIVGHACLELPASVEIEYTSELMAEAVDFPLKQHKVRTSSYTITTSLQTALYILISLARSIHGCGGTIWCPFTYIVRLA